MAFYLAILLCLSFLFNQNYSSDYVKNQIIVKFHSDRLINKNNLNRFNQTALSNINKILDVYDISLTGNKKNKDTFVVKYHKGLDISDVIKLYKDTGKFIYVEPNYIGVGGGQRDLIPNDTYFFRQWGLLNDGTFSSNATYDADIDMEEAWELEQGDSSIIIASLDSGIKLNHPEFSGRIWINHDEIENNFDEIGIDESNEINLSANNQINLDNEIVKNRVEQKENIIKDVESNKNLKKQKSKSNFF